jgi:mRNA interferase MazF
MEMISMLRGEIWLINLDPSVGAEIRKSRPAIIVSVDEVGVLPLRVVVPLTDWKEHYSRALWMVLVEPGVQNGLDKRSAADAFQIRSISTQRFIRKIGVLDAARFMQVLDAVNIVIGLD